VDDFAELFVPLAFYFDTIYSDYSSCCYNYFNPDCCYTLAYSESVGIHLRPSVLACDAELYWNSIDYENYIVDYTIYPHLMLLVSFDYYYSYYGYFAWVYYLSFGTRISSTHKSCVVMMWNCLRIGSSNYSFLVLVLLP